MAGTVQWAAVRTYLLLMRDPPQPQWMGFCRALSETEGKA